MRLIQKLGNKKSAPSNLFVLAHPTKKEEEVKEYLRSHEGKLFLRVLEIGEIDLDDCAITSLVGNVPELKPGKNSYKNPYVKDVREYLPDLQKDIAEHDFERIICLGAFVWKHLGDGTPFNRVRLKEVSNPNFGYMVTAILPPTALYDKSRLINVAEDIDALFNGTHDEEISWCILDREDPRDYLGDATNLVIDIETTGLSLGKPITHVGIKEESGNEVFIFKFKGNEDYFKSLLLNPDVTLTGHNIKFDIGRLAYALKVKTILCQAKDTMVYDFFKDEESTARSLERLSRIHTNLKDFKSETENLWANDEDIPFDTLAERCAYDVEATERVRIKLEDGLRERDEWSDNMDWLYQFMTPFIAHLERVGIGIDQKELRNQRRVVRARIIELQNTLDDFAPNVNPASPEQLAKLLYDWWEERPGPMGAKFPSTNVNHLKELVTEGTKSPEATLYIRALLEYRGYRKTYDSFLSQVGADETLVYPEYFHIKAESESGYDDIGGTVTGRIAVKRPAIQTFTKGHLRAIFKSRWEDGEIWCIDASQAELRVLATVSKCLVLLDLFRGFADLHQYTGDLNKVIRKMGKLINFASIYGASVPGLMVQTGLSRDKCIQIKATMEREWSELYDFINQIEEEAIANKRVTTPYGAIRRVPDASRNWGRGSHSLRQAVNFQGQKPGSDLVQILGRLILNESDMEYFTPIITVHDEIVMDVRDEKKGLACLTRALDKWREICHTKLGWCLDCPMVWDLSRGVNWAEQEDWKEIVT